MMKKTIINRIVWVFAALVLAVLVCLQSIPIPAFADSIIMTYDSTAIEDDLQDVDITQYPKNESGKPTFVRFVEYCYSTRPFLAETYGLYLYVYNPTEQKVNTNAKNVVNMATAYNSEGKPSAWNNVKLTYLDCTDNYRFYKFKVTDSATYLSLSQAYANANDGKRRYDVAGVQLWYTNGASSVIDGSIEKTYFYEGFAKGCGADSEAESTLTCNSETLETLSLDVHATNYRPEGTNGKNDYTQDSLHSVYFAVPNKYIEKYGEMVAVHATWLNAVLKPALVTGNQEAYAAIEAYLGVSLPEYESSAGGSGIGGADGPGIGGGGGGGRSVSTSEYHTDDLPYMYYGIMEAIGGSVSTQSYGFGYNALHDWSGHIMSMDSEMGYDVNPLYMMFNAGSATDSADSYVVTSEMLQAQMLASAEKYGGDLIQGANGSYSRAIFESVDSEYTDKTIRRDEERKLTSEVIGSSWWDKLWGITVTDRFDGIKAIYEVKDTDVTGNVSADCSNLYISEADYTNFSNFYMNNKADSTVYLFRYQVSDYISQEATLYHYIEDGNILTGSGWQVKDTNAYFFQETVNLNFEVIDVTFELKGKETVIPTVMAPIDIIPDVTPPVNTESDENPLSRLWAIIALVILLIGCVLCAPLLTSIISFVISIIVLPFKLLGSLFKGGKKE